MALLEDEQSRPPPSLQAMTQAMGVYEAARQLKIRIPKICPLSDSDDIQTAAYMGPALTTVRQPLQDMAATAARMVIDTNEGRKIQKRVVLSTSLVVQDSTRQLKSRISPTSERHRFLACLRIARASSR